MTGQAEAISNDAINDFNNRMGLLASHNYEISPDEIGEYVNDSQTGSPIEVQNSMENVFYQNIEGYITETFNGVLLNNVSNTNTFLRQNLDSEMGRIESILNQLKSSIYKTRIKILEKNYTVHHNRFRSRVIQATILLCLICFAILGAIETQGVNMNLGIILIALLLIVYVILLTLALRVNNKRRIDDWGKYYFDQPKKTTKK